MVATPQIRADIEVSAHVVREESELRSLASDWQKLFHTVECNNVFLSFEWISQWWAHFGRNSKLFVVTVRGNDGDLVAVIPLYISKAWRFPALRRLGLLGDQFVASDHLGFLVNQVHLSAAVEGARKVIFDRQQEWDFIELSSASPDSIALIQFQEVMLAAQMSIQKTPSSLCPYFHLPRTREEYWSGLRPKLRKNLRYQTRSLEREGQLKFVAIEDPSEITRALKELVRLHQLRSDRRGRKSTFLDPKVVAFHGGAIRALTSERNARIFFLEVSGKRIAALYGFCAGRKFCYYQSGADPAYSRFGVGTVLISSVIEWAIQNNYAEFDFLRGDEAYKQLWATGLTQLHDISFFDRRATSRMAQTVRFARNSLREWKAALVRRGTSSSDRCATVARTAL